MNMVDFMFENGNCENNICVRVMLSNEITEASGRR